MSAKRAAEIGTRFGSSLLGIFGGQGMLGAKVAEREHEEVVAARTEKQKEKARRTGAGRTVPMNIRATPALKAAMNALSRVDGVSRTTMIERLVMAEIERRGIEVLPSDEHGSSENG